MIRVFWWNGGAWHEDVPEAVALERIGLLKRMGYMTWWRRLEVRH
jgi:hypothetical protein